LEVKKTLVSTGYTNKQTKLQRRQDLFSKISYTKEPMYPLRDP
jgi:hypothetical protein